MWRNKYTNCTKTQDNKILLCTECQACFEQVTSKQNLLHYSGCRVQNSYTIAHISQGVSIHTLKVTAALNYHLGPVKGSQYSTTHTVSLRFNRTKAAECKWDSQQSFVCVSTGVEQPYTLRLNVLKSSRSVEVFFWIITPRKLIQVSNLKIFCNYNYSSKLR